jgi:hypothetical protein
LMLATVSWLLFERRINALKRYFPYAPAKDRNGAGTFANIGLTGWLGGTADTGAAAYLADPVANRVDRRKVFRGSGSETH